MGIEFAVYSENRKKDDFFFIKKLQFQFDLFEEFCLQKFVVHPISHTPFIPCEPQARAESALSINLVFLG